MNDDWKFLQIDTLFHAGIFVRVTLAETPRAYEQSVTYVCIDHDRSGLLLREPGEGSQRIVFIPWHRINEVEFLRKED